MYSFFSVSLSSECGSLKGDQYQFPVDWHYYTIIKSSILILDVQANIHVRIQNALIVHHSRVHSTQANQKQKLK